MRPRPAPRPLWVLAAIMALLAGCATLQQVAALRRVDFEIDRVSDVRIAGVRLDGRDSWSDLSALEAARLAAAATSREVPLACVLHLRAENPADNRVSARLVDMDWTFFIEDRRTVSGTFTGNTLLPPGQPVDLPLGVELDLADFFGGSARDLFEVALAVAGVGQREIRLEALPTIQTSVGPIRYPQPVVIRRTLGNG